MYRAKIAFKIDFRALAESVVIKTVWGLFRVEKYKKRREFPVNQCSGCNTRNEDLFSTVLLSNCPCLWIYVGMKLQISLNDQLSIILNRTIINKLFSI